MISSKHFLITLLLVWLNNSINFAQQYNFKNFTIKNGLAGSTINHIFEDQKGFIWFATSTGISQFNGKTFKNYTTKDGLVANGVTYITEDKKHNIWIATTSGVSKFDGKKFINYTTKQGLSKGEIFCIYVDAQNKLWLAINGGGVNIIEGEKIIKISSKEGLPNENIFSISQDKSGDYWFSMQHGVIRYDGVQFGEYDTSAYYNHQMFFTSMLDSKGNLWFGGYGVLKYNNKKLEKFELPKNIGGMISYITEDKKGNIWFATENGALKYEDNSFKLFTEKEGLSANFTLSIKADYEGNIWIGTFGGGANLFNNESFINYTDKDGLSSKVITSISADKDNKEYYIGTSTGINIFSSEETVKIKELKEIKQIDGAVINCTAIDNKGLLWIGTQDGVYAVEVKNKKYQLKKEYHKIDGQEIINVVKILQDKNNNYWVATQSSGAFMINDGVKKNYSLKNGFFTNNIFSMFEDHQSNLWFGTQDTGVVKFDGNNFINYGLKQGFPDRTVWAISEDEKGNLFFGTSENGLVCYNGKRFISYNPSNGLASNLINTLQWDKIDKCLWLGSENGINRVKIKDNLAIYEIQTYGEQEGFKGNEVTQNSCFIDNKGIVWFGSINGLNCYNRKYDFPNIAPPRIYLTEIKLDYKKVEWNKFCNTIDASTNLPKNLELSYKNNHLTFNFQALTTNKVKYTFILEGQDQEWSPLSENNEADYNNITPGKTYTFKVKAINSNGKWSNDNISFTFTIKAPWYATWWAYLIYFVTIISSAILLFKWRTASLKQQKRILEATVIERTVELNDSNEKLSHAFQEIKDSINYAKTIQQAILPLDEDIKNSLGDFFVLFKPRDVVSGDFYWFYSKDNKIYFAAIDCTGHGVPGAFMSMIGSSLLNEIVSKDEESDAARILNKLHEGVRKSLKQNREVFESKDGMDMALTVIDLSVKTLQYAGAKRPLFYYNGQTFIETKADKQSIGGLEIEHDFNFTNHNFELKKGDTFYMFTDGYIDQFGGEKDKKFSTLRLKSTLQELQHLSLKEQGIKLENIINNWKINTEQTDDILVIGFRF